jgi:hypothetical protein
MNCHTEADREMLASERLKAWRKSDDEIALGQRSIALVRSVGPAVSALPQLSWYCARDERMLVGPWEPLELEVQ